MTKKKKGINKKRTLKHPKLKRMNLSYVLNEIVRLTEGKETGSIRFRQLVGRKEELIK